MEYKIEGQNIYLSIPAANAGKFRFKKRKSGLDFGEIFATRKGSFDKEIYLEWQIGYDVPVLEVDKGKKDTKLKSKSFIGNNKKRKYPYELSEIFYNAMKLDFIPKKDVETLLEEIRGYKNFIDKNSITVEYHSRLTINGVNFQETSIKLPTLFMVETVDETQIEVSIQKQQYASGVQPMVYFCIPLTAFNNFADFYGRSSVSTDKFIYVINKNNALNLVYMMKVFGMASKRHNQDIVEILKILLKS